MASEVAEAVAAMILERKAAREAAHARRKESVKADRAEFAKRREHGLVTRHQAKLKAIQEWLV